MCTRISTKHWVQKAISVFGNKYDYSLVNYINNKTKVQIICLCHGSFWQSPKSHLNGHEGCPSCSKTGRKNTKSFVEKSLLVHGLKYGYEKVIYVNMHTNVEIICPIHGSFWKLAYTYLQGSGCPSCAHNGPSRAETEIAEFVSEELNFQIEKSNRKLIYPYELDILVPDKRIAIEYNGIHWHSTARKEDKNYHLKKTLACEKKGYRLIHIYEDQWKNKKEQMKTLLRRILLQEKENFRDRNLVIECVGVEQAKQFLSQHHINGYKRSKISYGIYDENVLVSYIGLSKRKNGWYVDRFESIQKPQQDFDLLLRHFQRNHEWNSIVLTSIRCYPEVIDYKSLGFSFAGYVSPKYDYTKSEIRFTKRQVSHNGLKKKLGFNFEKSEFENMKALGYHRIYNCGYSKFVLQREQ